MKQKIGKKSDKKNLITLFFSKCAFEDDNPLIRKPLTHTPNHKTPSD
jgi:hypothetical protein